jgi:hypothetical protein
MNWFKGLEASSLIFPLRADFRIKETKLDIKNLLMILTKSLANIAYQKFLLKLTQISAVRASYVYGTEIKCYPCCAYQKMLTFASCSIASNVL